MLIGNTCPCRRKCACHRLQKPGRCGIRQCCPDAGKVWLCGVFYSPEQAKRIIDAHASEHKAMQERVAAALATINK